jgi:hypothetical protein
MSSHNGARRNDTALPNSHTGENDASQADPHTVFDHNWPDFVRVWRTACPSELGIAGVTIGIHHNSAAGKIAISADGNFLTDSELTVMTNLAVVADLKERPIGEPGGKRDCDLAIESNIVAKNDISGALHIMHMAIGSQIPPVFRAIGLEQGFANKHA